MEFREANVSHSSRLNNVNIGASKMFGLRVFVGFGGPKVFRPVLII